MEKHCLAGFLHKPRYKEFAGGKTDFDRPVLPELGHLMRRWIMNRTLSWGAIGVGVGVALVAAMASVGFAQTAFGEDMVVTASNAPLMRGYSTLAALPAGHQFQVIRREGPWVGTRTNINGQTLSGWIWQGQAAPQQQFAQRPAARRYSYQPAAPIRRYSYLPAVPGAATPYRGPYPYAMPYLWPDMRDYVTGGVRSGSPLVMGATRYGRQYWRADRKIIGY